MNWTGGNLMKAILTKGMVSKRPNPKEPTKSFNSNQKFPKKVQSPMESPKPKSFWLKRKQSQSNLWLREMP